MIKKILYLNIFLIALLMGSCSDYEYLKIPDDMEIIEYEPAEVNKLNGTYLTESLEMGSYYGFTIGKDKQEAFFFDYGDGARDNNGLRLERVFVDESKGMMVFHIIKAAGYYEIRKNQYLTLFVRNISSDGSSCELAIATKTGVHSIKTSEGNVIATTLEEAKSLYPPSKKALFKNNMMSYAHMWIKLTREK